MKKIGLALGGGAVLGAAHIGVLKAIDEYDIEISYISGTSIGAFVGAFYAFGMSWKEIEDIAVNLKWLDVSKITLSKYGLLTNEKLDKLIKKHIGHKDLEESHIPLAVVATDAKDGSKVVMNSGSLSKSIMASTCIPGIFKPVNKGELLLIDGGIVENVPVKTVKDMGADYIIAVDLNGQRQNSKPKNIVDVIVNSFHFIMMHSDKIHTGEADLLIQPDLSAFSRAGTGQVDKIIDAGYETAKTVLDRDFSLH